MTKPVFRSAACFALLAIIFASCSKDNGNSGPASTNYSPLTANSTWTYQNTPGSPFTLTATNRDTLANGRTYRVLSNSAGANTYMAKDGDNYYRFGSFAEINLQAVEELYLKGSEAANAVWKTTQTVTLPNIPVPITVSLNYSIKEKGITHTSGGKAFNNVTRVRLDLSLVGLGSIGGGDFYYAEGVGMIENVINVTVPGQAAINQTQVLTSYSIK